MTLNILTARQGETCTIIKTECCVYIPDTSANVSSALRDLHSQINAMLDSATSFNDWLASWFPGTTWWDTIVIFLAMILCTGILFCCMIYYYCELMSHMSLASFRLPKNAGSSKMEPIIHMSPLDQSLARQGQHPSSA